MGKVLTLKLSLFHSILGDGLRFSFWLNMCMSSEKKSRANIRKTLLFSVLFS